MISPLLLQHEQAVEQAVGQAVEQSVCAMCHASRGGGSTSNPSLLSLADHKVNRTAE